MTSKEIMKIIEKRFAPYLNKGMCDDVKNMLIRGCIPMLHQERTECSYNSPILTVYDQDTGIKYRFKFIFNTNDIKVKELDCIKPTPFINILNFNEIYDIVYKWYHFTDMNIMLLIERFTCKGFKFIDSHSDAINNNNKANSILNPNDDVKVVSLDIEKDNISYHFNIVNTGEIFKFIPISITSDNKNIILDEGEGVQILSDGINYTKLKIESDSLAFTYSDKKGIIYDPKTINSVYIAFNNGDVNVYKCYCIDNSTKLNELFVKYNFNGIDIDVSLNQLKNEADIFIPDDCDGILLSDILKGIQMVIKQEGDLKVNKVMIDKDDFQMIIRKTIHMVNNYKDDLEKYKKENV